MVRAKICGVCRAADARAAVQAGADYVGVILAPGHRRTRTYEEAAQILDEVSVRRVGVFVDPAAEDVRSAVRSLGLDVVQLHGDESVELVQSLRSASDGSARPLVWKSVRVRSPADAAAELDRWSAVADAVLLDGWSGSGHGGTGSAFDWAAMRRVLQPRRGTCELVVAGGLTPENVAGVIRILDPDIVDVSSGVEAQLGRKSIEKMHAFIAAAKQDVVAQPSKE